MTIKIKCKHVWLIFPISIRFAMYIMKKSNKISANIDKEELKKAIKLSKKSLKNTPLFEGASSDGYKIIINI